MRNRHKVRFWDKQKKVMLYAEDLEGDIEFPECIIHPNGIFEIFDHKTKIWQGSDRYIRMDCTGMIDENDNDIYEGDIIGGVNGSINLEPWEWGPYEIKWIEKEGRYNVPLWGTPEERDSTHRYKVIGTIYENPELLEENNGK